MADIKATKYPPPQELRFAGLHLQICDETPLVMKGRQWFTYHIPGQPTLWEHCPETGRTVRTQN
jgi:hypothetical protein